MVPTRARFRKLYWTEYQSSYNPLDDLYEQHLNVAEYIRMPHIDDQHIRLVQDAARELEPTPGENGKWMYVGIYVEVREGSEERNRLFADCQSGKVNLILTQNLRTLDSDIEKAMSFCTELAALNPPVGVYIEDMGLYTCDEKQPGLLEYMMKLVSGRSEPDGLAE